MQPFGAGNLQPLFLVRQREGSSRPREFAPDCCELTIDDGTSKALAVLWPSSKALAPELVRGATVDLLVQIEPDGYAANGGSWWLLMRAEKQMLNVQW